MASEEIKVHIKNVRIFGETIGICELGKKRTLILSFLPQSIEFQIDANTDAHLHDQFVLTADIAFHHIERTKIEFK